MNLLEEIRTKPQNTSRSKDVLDKTLKVQVTRIKLDKLQQLRKKNEWQQAEWKKILGNF